MCGLGLYAYVVNFSCRFVFLYKWPCEGLGYAWYATFFLSFYFLSLFFPPILFPVPSLSSSFFICCMFSHFTGNVEENDSISRALSRLSEVEERVEALHQEQVRKTNEEVDDKERSKT